MYPGIRRLLCFISFQHVMLGSHEDDGSDALIPAKAYPEEENSLLWYNEEISGFGERLMGFIHLYFKSQL